MVLSNNNEAIQRTRDELSSEPNIQPIYKIKTESLIVEEGPMIINKVTVGHSFILGHPDNGRLGTTYLGDDGSQVVLGEAGRVTTLFAVYNNKSTFIDRFRFTNFEDTGSTTADWADTVGSLIMTNTEIAQSLTIGKKGSNFVSAKITVVVSSGVVGDLAFVLSADGGSNWESATHDTTHVFTNAGDDLRFKITASGSVTLSSVKVKYT